MKVCVFLLSLVFFSANALYIKFEGILNQTSPSHSFLPITANLHNNTGTINLNHTKDIQVCFQRMVPTPPINYFEFCSNYMQFESKFGLEVSSSEFYLLNEEYYITISLINENETDEINVTLSGTECPEDNPIWNGNVCTNYVSVHKGADNVSIVGGVGGYFMFDVMPLAQNLTIIAEGNHSLQLSVCYSCVPAQVNDGAGVNNLTIVNPQPGNWTLFVNSSNSNEVINFTLHFHTNKCPEFSVGINCSTQIFPLNETKTIEQEIMANSWVYFILENLSSKSFNVSVSSNNQSYFPEVYLSLGQIPTENSYILRGCNQQLCGYSHILSVPSSNITANNTWIIGVRGSDVETDFGIWVDSVCPPECKKHGKCSFEPKSFGKCICKEYYLGLSCSEFFWTGGLSAQYICLISSLIGVPIVVVFIVCLFQQKEE